MKTTVRNNITDLPYSLHDAVVTAVNIEGDFPVTLCFEKGFFEPSEGDCRRVDGYVAIDGIDNDFCNVYVFNGTKNEGAFRGRKMPLKPFAEKYFRCFHGSNRSKCSCLSLSGEVSGDYADGGVVVKNCVFKRNLRNSLPQSASLTAPSSEGAVAVRFNQRLLKEKPDCSRFEIVSETYGYNKSTFSGWLWVKNKPKECVLELYHTGEMKYVVEIKQ